MIYSEELLQVMRANPVVTLRAMLTTPALRQPLLIAVMMMLAQQLTGINAVVFFSTKIFKVRSSARRCLSYAVPPVYDVSI